MSDAIFSYHYLCIDFDLDCEFGDPQTEEQYHQEKQSFIARNQHRDTHFSFSESRNLQDFTPKMLSIVASTQKSLLLHWFPYLLATLLLLSWPYRLWFDRQTVYGQFRFQKRIFV